MPVAIPLAIAGAGVAGAAMSAKASKSAASTVSQSSDRAADLQNQQFNKMLQLSMPGYNRAEGAAGTYMQALGLAPQMSSGGPATVPASSLFGQQQGQPNYTGMMTGSQSPTGGPAWKFDDLGGFNPELEPQAQGQTTIQPVGQPQQVPAGGTPATGTPAPALNIADQVRNTPGYQAQLQEGITSIDRAAPLVGGMYSGRRMKALADHNQNTFGTYYNDWLNRVGGIAGQAPQIAGNIGQAGMQNANNVGNLMMTGANARAQGQQNSASAWTGAIGTGIGLYGGSQGWFGR